MLHHHRQIVQNDFLRHIFKGFHPYSKSHVRNAATFTKKGCFASQLENCSPDVWQQNGEGPGGAGGARRRRGGREDVEEAINVIISSSSQRYNLLPPLGGVFAGQHTLLLQIVLIFALHFLVES